MDRVQRSQELPFSKDLKFRIITKTTIYWSTMIWIRRQIKRFLKTTMLKLKLVLNFRILKQRIISSYHLLTIAEKPIENLSKKVAVTLKTLQKSITMIIMSWDYSNLNTEYSKLLISINFDLKTSWIWWFEY